MREETKKEVKRRLISILETTCFLVLTTWYWFGIRTKVTKAMGQVAESKNPIVNLIMTENKESPNQFSVYNNGSDEASYVVVVRGTSNDKLCQLAENNYVNYQLTVDNEKQVERSLSLSGTIYQDNIKPTEKRNYQFEYEINDKDLCFTPQIELLGYQD